MKAALGKEKYLALALASISLLLVGVLLWEWAQGKNLERDLLKMRKLPVTAVPPQKILPEFSLPDKETGFPELLSRPVFSVSRRSTGTAAKGIASMKKGQFVLVGVLISPRQTSALLRDVASNKTETVTLVGVVRGLTLGEVKADRVVLRQGAESEELMLNVQNGPKLPGAMQNQPAPQSGALPAAPPASAATPGKPAVAPAAVGAAPAALPAASSARPAVATSPASANPPPTAIAK